VQTIPNGATAKRSIDPGGTFPGGNRITGRQVAGVERSVYVQAVVPFHDSSGSHCRAGAWVGPRETQQRHTSRLRLIGYGMPQPSNHRAPQPEHPPSHAADLFRAPPSGRTP
jgi:hypothetical protein